MLSFQLIIDEADSRHYCRLMISHATMMHFAIFAAAVRRQAAS